MMIIRQALLRHGQRIAPPARRVWARSLATPSIDSIEQSMQTAIREAHSIQTQLQDVPDEPAPQAFVPYSAAKRTYDPQPVEAYRQRKHQAKRVGRLGTQIEKTYLPGSLVENPPSPADITLPLLLSAQAHMGHSTSLWNPMNSRYIFGVRQGIHVISLEATASHLRRACRIASGVAERGGLILFVGTRKGQARTVIQAARRARGCYQFDRWTPGAITNGLLILGPAPISAVDPLDRPIEGFEEELSEVAPLKPDLVVCLNPVENYVLLRECGQHHIPTIGIVDTDADPTWVTYPIPANDDSLRCVQLISGALAVAASQGHAERIEKAKAGQLTYKPVNLEDMRFKD